ncbi:MAG TPA: hypothetical protein VER33_18190 [Polyangiaceae bacterium]|nr:hypothetical protein [Polyangiaceae bacterium]
MAFESTSQTLGSLRDVEGVQGSFVLTEAGELVGTDLPALLLREMFVETGPRIVRLCETLEHGGESIESLAIRFTDHKLHVRRSRVGFLCVFANTDTNAPALKMALALVARRLETSGQSHAAEAALPSPAGVATTTIVSATTPSASAPPASSKPLQSYRGVRLRS